MQTMTTIDPDITMRDLLVAVPGAQRALFKKYHIGGCSSCGFQPEETLRGVCERNENVSVDDAIEHILTSHQEDLKLQITPQELAEQLQQDDAPEIMDVRTREEFEVARISGSVLFTQDLMQEILGQWDRSELLVLVDHKGTRSMDAAAFFAGHGFTNVKSLVGGIDAWSEKIDSSIPRYDLE